MNEGEKKMLKRTIIIIMACILIFSGSVMASEGNNNQFPDVPERALNAYLSSANYPQEFIDSCPYQVKLILFREKGTYISHTTESQYFVDSSDIDTLAEMGILSLPNFTQTVSVSKLTTTTPGIARYHIYYNWVWRHTPFWHLIDKYGIAWNGDWNYETGSFNAGYMYKRDGWSDVWEFNNQSVSLDTATPGTGVGWKVDILSKGYGHSGWGAVNLLKSHDKSGRSDVSSYSAGYFHKVFGATGSLTFSKTPSVSITYVSSYQTSSPQAGSWIWYHRD